MTGIIKTDQLQGAQSSTIAVPSGNNLTVGGTLAVTGETTLATHLNLGDGDIIKLGASADLQIQHTSTNSIIDDQGTGNFELRTNGTDIRITGNSGTDFMGRFISNGAASLYYDGSQKIATTSSGAAVTGNATISGVLSVGGNTTLNGKFLIDGSNNDLMTFRTTGDTASQVLGLQFQNNSEAVTAQIFGTGDNSTNGVFRIKGIGSIELHGGDVGVTGDATKMMKIDASGVAQFRSSGISAGNQVFQVIDDGATLFQIRAEDGNISFPQAGAGIYLGVTSGTASNLLNDYEEGTFTPIFVNVSAPTYSSQLGKYTKIGNTVHCTLSINVSSGMDNTDGSTVSVAGLPFTAIYSEEATNASLGRYTSLLGSKATSVTNFRQAEIAILLHEGNDAGVAYNEIASSGILQMAFTYRTTQ